MAREILNNLDTYGIQRGKINANFSELYLSQLTPADVLTKTNTSPYTPTSPYHPATKQYADSIGENWSGVYDPTNVNADAFDRQNHHGQMQAQYVTEDPDNRFVSDAQISSWNAKEDSIGPKGTAFNKDFGTISGSVAEGNHDHTGTYEPANVNIQDHIATTSGNPHQVTAAEAGAEPVNTNIQGHIAQVTGNPHAVTQDDVGLGNVDNTSDADKPVSNDTLTAIANKLDNSVAVFVPQTAPAAGEGQVYYDSEKHALSVIADVDSILNIGQEQVIRVINNTGATIVNGAVVRATLAVGGLPQIVLAQADTQANANAAGIATHDILDGSQGFVTTFGSLGGDYSAFTDGDRVYLSESVAGTITNVAPDIVTRLGGVLDASASGAMFVKVRNNTALPNVIAYMNGGSLPTTVDDTPTTITNYTSHGNIVIDYDPVTGGITVATGGVYKISATINFTHDDVGSSSGTATLHVYDGTADKLAVEFGVLRNQEATNLSLSGVAFEAAAGETFYLRVSSTETLTGVVPSAIGFNIESFNIR